LQATIAHSFDKKIAGFNHRGGGMESAICPLEFNLLRYSF